MTREFKIVVSAAFFIAMCCEVLGLIVGDARWCGAGMVSFPAITFPYLLWRS